jgi:putative DNA primase/helicase
MNFGLWPLIGKSLAIISDARLSGRSDTANVVEHLLAISGEDAQTIDRKNLEPVTCTLPTRFVILSNELPRLHDSSGALVSRLVMLRLTRSFLGREDHGLTEKLLAELPGILLWSIEGYKRLRQFGRFIQPRTSTELIEEMEGLASPVSLFVRDCCQVGDAEEIERSELYAAYQEWAKKNGKGFIEDQAGFGRALRAFIPTLRDEQHRVFNKPRRFYRGLGLAIE